MARFFAIIPAAGTSSRMGQPKLLLPWSGQPLIAHTILAWQRSKIDRIAVVIRADDGPLIEAVRPTGADVILPDAPPPDMKSSVQAALRHIERQYRPADNDAFLVAPADMPQLSPLIIDRLIEHHLRNPSNQILTPTLDGKRGHPVLFPWVVAAEVASLAPEVGLDAVVYNHACVSVSCDDLTPADESPFADIDTPGEYRAIQREAL